MFFDPDGRDIKNNAPVGSPTWVITEFVSTFSSSFVDGVVTNKNVEMTITTGSLKDPKDPDGKPLQGGEGGELTGVDKNYGNRRINVEIDPDIAEKNGKPPATTDREMDAALMGLATALYASTVSDAQYNQLIQNTPGSHPDNDERWLHALGLLHETLDKVGEVNGLAAMWWERFNGAQTSFARLEFIVTVSEKFRGVKPDGIQGPPRP